MAAARVASLHMYPLKGGRAVSLEEATVTPRGIVGDRRYMVVDERGRFVSQREISRLALITAEILDGGLRLSVPDGGVFELPSVSDPDARRVVRLWKDDCEAFDQGDRAAAWLSAFLGRSCRLVRQPDAAQRLVDPAYALASTDIVSFADGFPLLVCSARSLRDLNAHLEVPLPMNRFRPNLVVEGWPQPWWEDRVSRLRAGQVELALVKHCARCVVTTVNQRTAQRGPEPLRTLARIRRRPRGVMFGQNAIPTLVGRVAVGDPVETIEMLEEDREPPVAVARSRS